MLVDDVFKIRLKFKIYYIIVYFIYSFYFIYSKISCKNPIDEPELTKKKIKKNIILTDNNKNSNEDNNENIKIDEENNIENENIYKNDNDLNKNIIIEEKNKDQNNKNKNNNNLEEIDDDEISTDNEDENNKDENNEINEININNDNLEENNKDEIEKINEINEINNKLIEELNNLKYASIKENLEIYKNIFYKIIKKCRENVYFYPNNNIINNNEILSENKNNIKNGTIRYIKFNNIYDILDNFDKKNLKINCNYYDIKEYIENVNGIDVFIIKDPVYNFIYTIKCDSFQNCENKKDLDSNEELFLRNNGDKFKCNYNGKLYFYLNEIEDENDKNKLQESKYLIFFKYILELLDESTIICEKTDNNKNTKFFIKTMKGMNVFTSIGTNKKSPININNSTYIAKGDIK